MPFIDILLITAVEDEFEIVKSSESDWVEHKDNKDFVYLTRTFLDKNGDEISLALARPINMGLEYSSNIATRLTNFLNPICLSMVGVCAGWKDKVNLGDVIVAKRVFNYEAGKLKAFLEDKVRKEEVFHDILTFNLKPTWIQKAQSLDSIWIDEINTSRPITFYYQELWYLNALNNFENGSGIIPDKLEERPINCPNWNIILPRLEKKKLIEFKDKFVLTTEGKNYINRLMQLNPDGLPLDIPFPRVFVEPMGSGAQVKEDFDLFPTIARHVRTVGIIPDWE